MFETYMGIFYLFVEYLVFSVVKKNDPESYRMMGGDRILQIVEAKNTIDPNFVRNTNRVPLMGYIYRKAVFALEKCEQKSEQAPKKKWASAMNLETKWKKHFVFFQLFWKTNRFQFPVKLYYSSQNDWIK